MECKLTKPQIYKEHWCYFLILWRFVSFIICYFSSYNSLLESTVPCRKKMVQVKSIASYWKKKKKWKEQLKTKKKDEKLKFYSLQVFCCINPLSIHTFVLKSILIWIGFIPIPSCLSSLLAQNLFSKFIK